MFFHLSFIFYCDAHPLKNINNNLQNDKKHIRRADQTQHSPHIHEPLICIRKTLRSLVKPHGAFMPREIVLSETVLYSSLCTDIVIAWNKPRIYRYHIKHNKCCDVCVYWNCVAERRCTCGKNKNVLHVIFWGRQANADIKQLKMVAQHVLVVLCCLVCILANNGVKRSGDYIMLKFWFQKINFMTET